MLTAAVSADGRSLSLYTAARVEAVNYAITLPDLSRDSSPIKFKNSLPQVAAIDLSHDLSGVEAQWRAERRALHLCADYKVKRKIDASRCLEFPTTHRVGGGATMPFEFH